MRPVFSNKNGVMLDQVNELVGVWEEIDPLSIGLDAARVLALKNARITAAATKLDMDNKRRAAEAATQLFNEECRVVRTLGGNAVRSIDSFARDTNDPKVWSMAAIPAPKTPGTSPPPAQPHSFTAGIDGDGNLTVKWKCSNPRGVSSVIYQVSRRLNNTGAFTFLDTVGEKKIVDGTIPPGTRAVTYKVVGKRGQQVGQVSDQFTVQFGMDGDGMNIAESFTGTGQNVGKLAA